MPNNDSDSPSALARAAYAQDTVARETTREPVAQATRELNLGRAPRHTREPREPVAQATRELKLDQPRDSASPEGTPRISRTEERAAAPAPGTMTRNVGRLAALGLLGGLAIGALGRRHRRRGRRSSRS